MGPTGREFLESAKKAWASIREMQRKISGSLADLLSGWIESRKTEELNEENRGKEGVRVTAGY